MGDSSIIMIAIINTVCIGSTGKIATGLQRYLISQGKDAIMCYGRGPAPDTPNYRFCSQIEVYLHYQMQHISGQYCIGSKRATRRLVSFLKNNNVEAVFLVNLHGYYLNEKILFDFLCEKKIRVVYIMADESACWGNCTYANGCKLYLQECFNCKNISGLQKMLFREVSHKAFCIKRNAYNKMNATFVAPEFVIKSVQNSLLLKDKKLEVVDEAIDVSVSKPRDAKVLKAQLGINDDKIVITCVAPYAPGYERKGVPFFIETARRLEYDDRFVFLHVGYSYKDKSHLPSNYKAIGYVDNAEELSYYYSMGDLFVFPSLADTMPNACLEALACGTPLLCFNISGMPYLGDESVLTLVEAQNIDQMVDVILKTKKKTQLQIETCRNYALERYDNKKYFERLVSIMEQLK